MNKDSRYSNLPKSEGFKDTKSVSSNQKTNLIASSRTWLSMLFQKMQRIPAKMAMILGGSERLIANWFKGVKRFSAVSALVVVTILAGHTVSAQIINPGSSQPLASLKTVSIPEPDNLNDFVLNKTATIALGKSLFWDMQLGTDGIQSCASCHFHAGADNRSKNQINPGQGKVFDIGGRPNYQLAKADYPFHKLSDTNNRSSTVIADSNDITGSQGVFRTKFVDVNPGKAEDIVEPLKDDLFNVNNVNVRQVTGRNSPTTINAVFNFRNFWDGRAQNNFNGVNEFGLRDRNAFILKATDPNNLLDVLVNLKNSSLASQAVSPPISAFEVAAEDLPIAPLRVSLVPSTGQVTVRSATKQEVINNSSGDIDEDDLDDLEDNSSSNRSSSAQLTQGEQLKPLKRIGRKLGKKLNVLRPLNKQLVAKDDSVLGSYSQGEKPGLFHSKKLQKMP